jgi:hypothetical protein
MSLLFKFLEVYIFVNGLILSYLCEPCQNGSLTCLNGGVFNEKICACQCFPSYSGNTCEKISCDTLDPSSCHTFAKGLCSIAIINDYCPKLCEKQCNTRKCLNGAKTKNNQCECLPQFEGKTCENIKCLKEDQRCFVINILVI